MEIVDWNSRIQPRSCSSEPFQWRSVVWAFAESEMSGLVLRFEAESLTSARAAASSGGAQVATILKYADSLSGEGVPMDGRTRRRVC